MVLSVININILSKLSIIIINIYIPNIIYIKMKSSIIILLLIL